MLTAQLGTSVNLLVRLPITHLDHFQPRQRLYLTIMTRTATSDSQKNCTRFRRDRAQLLHSQRWTPQDTCEETWSVVGHGQGEADSPAPQESGDVLILGRMRAVLGGASRS